MDAVGPVIDVEPVFSQEPDQDDIEFPGNLHGQAGRRADGGYHRNSSHERLLQ